MQKKIILHEKFNAINDEKRYVLIWGGRASGKSWGMAITLILKAIEEPGVIILCAREKQNSMAESVKSLLHQVIKLLNIEHYFNIQRDIIQCKNGSVFHFRGLWATADLSSSLKGFEACKYCWVEEAQDVTKNSIDVLTPTIRAPGSRIFFTMNRKRVHDPVWDFFSFLPESEKTLININYLDNPHASVEILKEAELSKNMDNSDYYHIWMGMPEEQGSNTVLKRTEIEQMYKNSHIPAEGQEVIGVDVARFGSDTSQIYRRVGNVIVEHKSYTKMDNITLAREVLSMATNEYTIFIIDETGLGGGVVDYINEHSKYVIPINFGSSANNDAFYSNRISELWFMLKEIIQDVYISIEFDDELMSELECRRYSYTTKNKITIEPKKEVKKEIGRSPDKADAFILCLVGNYNTVRKNTPVFLTYKRKNK